MNSSFRATGRRPSVAVWGGDMSATANRGSNCSLKRAMDAPRVGVRLDLTDTTAFLGSMRVDLSPRLGGHTVANQPPTTVLSVTFILSPLPLGTV